ncbi:MAG: MarR family transcriptional regulator [Theionarchaea archaeon]|nr:MarR family transcriptional regulator [Theionarchaea archaeon]
MNQVTTSARRILDMLRGTELSQKEIIRQSGMTERAVRYILNDLLSSDLISIKRSSKDRRMKLYTLISDIIS